MTEEDPIILTNVRRLGLMGGTFDPIHQGHLVAAEAARIKFQLDKVVFVPSGQPPHKADKVVTPKEIRYLMTGMAIASNPHFEISRAELERTGYSYSADTVRYFYERMDEDRDLFFITGLDAVMEILTWKKLDEFFAHCTLIAATRPGFSPQDVKERLKAQLAPKYYQKVIPFVMPAMDISSTDIRNRIALGQPIKYLLPETVEQYIYKLGLYDNG